MAVAETWRARKRQCSDSVSSQRVQEGKVGEEKLLGWTIEVSTERVVGYVGAWNSGRAIF